MLKISFGAGDFEAGAFAGARSRYSSGSTKMMQFLAARAPAPQHCLKHTGNSSGTLMFIFQLTVVTNSLYTHSRRSRFLKFNNPYIDLICGNNAKTILLNTFFQNFKTFYAEMRK
jgi:hypothetical protein